MWCIWWTVLLYMYSAAGFLPLIEAQGNKIVKLCHSNGRWSAVKCADDSGLVISGISTATFMRTHSMCDFKGRIEAESDISKCSPQNSREQQLTWQALWKACLNRQHCGEVANRNYVNTLVNCSVNGSIHADWNAIRISYTCHHNESAAPPVAPSTHGTSRPATDKTLKASTTAEPGTTDIQALITGAAVDGALLLCVGVAVTIICVYRRRLPRVGNYNATCIESSDQPRTRNASQAVRSTEELPLDTPSSGQYEPLHGVTTSTPVMYENVHASNYESLVDPRNERGDSGLGPTYEVVAPITEPAEVNYVNF